MSKLDPIYVYNRHQSPVSALCFGNLDDQPIIVTGANDGELHVWSLNNFTTLLKIQQQQVHQSKILGLESIGCLNEWPQSINKRMNDCCSNQTNQPTTLNSTRDVNIEQQTQIDTMQQPQNEQTKDNDKQTRETSARSSVSNFRFISQEKNGQLKFIQLFASDNDDDGKQIMKYNVYNELECSDCTFCAFQVFNIVDHLLLLAYIATKSTNCINLVIMNADGEMMIMNRKAIEIDQNYGMITSLRMKMNENGLVLIVIGTETGCCLIYASYLNYQCAFHSHDSSSHTIIDEFMNGFGVVRFKQECFKNTFLSSIELNDSKVGELELICGSVEDCLAIINLAFITIDDQRSSSSTSSSTSLRNEIKFKIQDKPVKYLKITNKGINSIVRRNDNRLFASAGWDARIRLFSMKTHKTLAVLNFHKQTIEMIKFSTYLNQYKGYLLAAVSQDKLVSIWSIYNGQL